MKGLKGCNVTVMVSNIDAGVDFYTQKLGLELKQRYGDYYAEIEAPGLKIGLHPTSDKVQKGNNLSIGFGVGDFDQALEDLKTKGIKIQVEEEGWGRLGNFEDPDGNKLYLAEIK